MTRPRRCWVKRLRRCVDERPQRLSPCAVLWLAALLTALALGCQTDVVPPTPPPAPGAFWPEQAALDFEGLERIEDRSSGSRGARSARRRLRRSLAARGIESEEWSLSVPGDRAGYPDAGERELVTLVGKIPGASPDVFLLAAHYDTARLPGPEGAVEDASGAALVLGLGRALVERDLPYSVWLVFIDGDAAAPRSGEAAAGGRSFSGSAALVERLAQRGDLEHVRLAVFFRQVAGAPLEIARDLHSHRVYREIFFDSARDLGHDEAFGAGGRYVSGATGHRAFLARDLRQVVAITGGPPVTAPSLEAASAQAPAPDPAVALGSVGEVTLEALDRIAEQLRRIDRFAEAPLEGRGVVSDGSGPKTVDPVEDGAETSGAPDTAGSAVVEGPASGAD